MQVPYRRQSISFATQATAESGLTPFDIANVNSAALDFGSQLLESEFNDHYGLVAPEETVLIRAYSDDSDDRILAELQPRFIVMYEPNMEFIRRIEVYRSSHPGLGVRVYHMVYGNSCEEHQYLAGIRKEKDSFERLIKERGVSTASFMDWPSCLTPLLSYIVHATAYHRGEKRRGWV
jgi:DNA excision repair protein ERCC-4